VGISLKGDRKFCTTKLW